MPADLEQHLGREEIKAIIPHREPFILIDEIIEMDLEERRIVGMIHDIGAIDFLSGHFPGFMVMPGGLLVEALAEVGAVGVLSLPQNKGKIVMLTGLNEWKFRKPALPGHEILIEASITHFRTNFGRGEGKITSEGELLAEGKLSFGITERPQGL